MGNTSARPRKRLRNSAIFVSVVECRSIRWAACPDVAVVGGDGSAAGVGRKASISATIAARSLSSAVSCAVSSASLVSGCVIDVFGDCPCSPTLAGRNYASLCPVRAVYAFRRRIPMPICPQVSDLIDTDRVTNSRPFTLADGDAWVPTLCSQFYSDWWSFGAPFRIKPLTRISLRSLYNNGLAFARSTFPERRHPVRKPATKTCGSAAPARLRADSAPATIGVKLGSVSRCESVHCRSNGIANRPPDFLNTFSPCRTNSTDPAPSAGRQQPIRRLSVVAREVVNRSGRCVAVRRRARTRL